VTRVVLTQPAPRVERLARRLRSHGHEVVELPSRRLEVPGGDAAGAALHSLAEYDWVVFVSPGAVEAALEGRRDPWPAGVGIAVIGPGSEQALAEYGLRAPAVRIVRPPAAPYDADALLRAPPFAAPAGARILVLRGEAGRVDWMQTLRERGAQVDAVSLYRTRALELPAEGLTVLRRWAASGAAARFVFTSVDAVEAVTGWLSEPPLRGWALAQTALTVHRRIEDALRARGWAAARLVEPGESALLAALESR